VKREKRGEKNPKNRNRALSQSSKEELVASKMVYGDTQLYGE